LQVSIQEQEAAQAAQDDWAARYAALEAAFEKEKKAHNRTKEMKRAAAKAAAAAAEMSNADAQAALDGEDAGNVKRIEELEQRVDDLETENETQEEKHMTVVTGKDKTIEVRKSGIKCPCCALFCTHAT
jgi:hypothetical protein